MQKLGDLWKCTFSCKVVCNVLNSKHVCLFLRGRSSQQQQKNISAVFVPNLRPLKKNKIKESAKNLYFKVKPSLFFPDLRSRMSSPGLRLGLRSALCWRQRCPPSSPGRRRKCWRRMPRLPRHQRTASQGGEQTLIIHDTVCVFLYYQNIHSCVKVRTFLGKKACPKACLRVKIWFKV